MYFFARVTEQADLLEFSESEDEGKGEVEDPMI